MNKFGFTPGPWKASKGHIGSKIADFVSTDSFKYDGIHIHNGEKDFGVSTKESEANACLIASAPEMLDVLIEVLIKDLDYLGPGRRALIKNIIEKATGKIWEGIINGSI